MAARRSRRALLVTFAVSAALHLALLMLRPEAPLPVATREPIELELVDDLPRPPKLESLPTLRASSGAQVHAPKAHSSVEATKKAPNVAPHDGANDGVEKRLASDRPLRDFNAPSPGPSGHPLPPGEGRIPDLTEPQLLRWAPETPSLTPKPPPDEHAHLVHNRPEELPDPAVVAEVAKEQARAKVQGYLEGGFATVRVNDGAVDSYFVGLKHQLEKSTQSPPLFVEPFSVEHLDRFVKQHGSLALEAWQQSARQYGASGTPYYSPEAMAQGEVPSVVQRELDRGSTQAREFAQTLQVGARLRDFGNGKMGAELVAVVELRQSSTGALLHSLLLQSSGNKPFDAWVMGQAIDGVGVELAVPDAGLGIHPEGMRSVWAFAGKVVYKRSMSELKLKDDWWYLLGALATSALAGNFDETTGKVEYIDLRHPSFECKVSLLQVY